MTEGKRTPAFREDLCDLCGQCFHLCPVLQLPLEESKKEIRRLIEGKDSKYVLSRCNTCFSCNLYCPQNANPYQLILERWNDQYKKIGAPPLMKFVCPTEEPNAWQLLNIFLSNEEKRYVYKWMNTIPKPNDIVLFIDTFIHLFPFILGGSKLLDFFTPIDKLDRWCAGGYLYQLGYMDLVQEISEATKKDLDKWNVKKVVPTLDAIDHMFREVHPKEMGVNHDQEFTSLNNFIYEKINSGEINLPKKLNLTVTIHDNCFSKAEGGAYWDAPREILEKCGCEILEMKHIRKDSLCCGFGTGVSWVKNISIPFDMISQGAKKFKEAEDTRAKALVTYCGGCLYLLWATRELIGSKIEIFHIIEVVRMAMGEKLNYPNEHLKRAWDIITIITYQLMVSAIQKNFFIKKISFDKQMSTFWPKKDMTIKILRYMFNLKLMRKMYSKLFRMMVPLMKTR